MICRGSSIVSSGIGLSRLRPDHTSIGARLHELLGRGGWSGLVQRRYLGLLIDRIAQQTEFDRCQVDVAEIVDEVAPRIGDPMYPRDEGHDATDFQPLFIDRPAADQKR